MRDFAITSVICFLLIFLLEAFFFLVENFSMVGCSESVSEKRYQTDRRYKADSYLDENISKEYFYHFHKANESKWYPYLYWRREGYKSDYINIDKNGVRKTCGNECTDSKKFRIFIFGGSTVWGTGVGDCETIPTYVSKMLSEKGICAEVLNFGETGYVSFQETISFLLNLRKGNIPDIAIFYNGVNDVYSAFQQCQAGIPQNEYRRRANCKTPESLKRV